MDYLNFIGDYIKEKHGKSVVFWADMISNYPDSHRRIAKNSIALEWGYDLILRNI